METMQGMEQTVVPGGAQPSEDSVVRSQLWKKSTEKFLKGEPKVLGVVQVMIALINLSLGIIMISIPLVHQPAISLVLGVPAWGPLMFILSGSLSIAAGVRTTKKLVTSSLVLNTISSVLAATASIIGVISVMLGLRGPFRRNEIEQGMDYLMLFLNMLEFCIAVSVSAFGCKVSCCNISEVLVVRYSVPAVTTVASPMLPQPSSPPEYQGGNVSENLYKDTTGGV
ncbi:membrane-spanning 4-domains subfamily A member 4D-like [Acomys russatus]|uniref:membrane-spanning 4-domains subfamily A member 4D-like n=1 Tax=Acomys russatus TaxID=60746 RepID=UPI0021E2BE96|nr:membrane-spanning 4-domains subfamily A member 4D-like [Acomys russatus]